MNPAILYLLFATSLFSLINALVKYLSHIPAEELVFFRGLLTAVVCAGLLYYRKIPLLGKNRKVLVLRGLFGSIALFSYFACIQNIPLAVAVTLINLTPLFTVMVAHFYMKERANLSQWLFLIFSFVGVILVRGETSPVPWIWIFIGTLGSLIAAGAYTCIRKLGDEDTFVVILYFPLITTPLIGPLVVMNWQMPIEQDWLLIAGIAILTLVAQFFMTKAYQIEKAAKVMVFNYAGLLWGILIGWIYFNESLSQMQLLGVLVVFLCLCGNLIVSSKGKIKLDAKK